MKLITSEYNSILFRTPPQRVLPDSDETGEFLNDVDGEGNSINEFMSLVDIYTTVYGVCHIGCYKPIGSDIPKWRIHTPLDVTNWSYYYDVDGNLKLRDIVIKLEDCDEYSVYRYITKDTMETVFIGEDSDYAPDVDSPDLEQLDDSVYRIVQPNELGYIPIKTVYQSTKVYNGVGSTIIQDVAQIQRSIYGDMAEVYSAITYGAHPVTIVDEVTDQLNDGEIGAEPGSVVRVQHSVTGEPTYTYEFKSPKLDAIGEISDLVDSKIKKLTQIAMLRTEDLVRSSRSGEQIEVYDDKLAGLIRRKSVNLENAEAKLWKVWADWMNMALPEDFSISYSRHYNKRSLEQELGELDKMLMVHEKFMNQLGEDGVDQELNADLREKIAYRLKQLLNSSSTDNGY